MNGSLLFLHTNILHRCMLRLSPTHFIHLYKTNSSVVELVQPAIVHSLGRILLHRKLVSSATSTALGLEKRKFRIDGNQTTPPAASLHNIGVAQAWLDNHDGQLPGRLSSHHHSPHGFDRGASCCL